jgi:3'-phosphoadenosine 5'-phosphosulfate sulfotransferase (PAPS reductase)/FAD synthetase
MESNNYILNKRYKSKINTIAVDCDYEIKKMSDISEEILKENGITNISVFHEKEFVPIMIIVYENKDVKKIDDLTEMKKFIQKLQK